jgi:hypothetical protein
LSRARLSGPAEARVIALAEDVAAAVIDRFESSKRARGLLALVQEHDGDIHEIRIEVRGRTRKGDLLGAGGWFTIPALGVHPPETEPDKPKRKRRKPKRPA